VNADAVDAARGTCGRSGAAEWGRFCREPAVERSGERRFDDEASIGENGLKTDYKISAPI